MKRVCFFILGKKTHGLFVRYEISNKPGDCFVGLQAPRKNVFFHVIAKSEREGGFFADFFLRHCEERAQRATKQSRTQKVRTTINDKIAKYAKKERQKIVLVITVNVKFFDLSE